MSMILSLSFSMATRTVTRRADGDRLPKNFFEDRYCADGSMHPYLKPLCSLPPHLPLIQCQKDDIFTTRPPSKVVSAQSVGDMWFSWWMGDGGRQA